MNEVRRPYSDVLKFNSQTIYRLIHTAEGRAWSLKMLLVVGLIAGVGYWIGLPAVFARPTLAEAIDRVGSATATGVDAVTSAIAGVFTGDDPTEVAMAVTSGLEEDASDLTAQLDETLASLTGSVPSVEELLQRRSVTGTQIEQVVANANVTADQLGQLVERADLTPAQLDGILARANLTPDQAAELRTRAESALGALSAELKPLLDGLSMDAQQFQELLAPLGLTAQQVSQVLKGLAITPQEAGQALAQLQATPQELQNLVDDVSGSVAALEPVIGVRLSRVLVLTGQWLATPFQIMATWALFALALLVVSKLLGGHATLPEHIAAVALAAAPLILTMGTYIPDISRVTSVPFDIAVHFVGRVFALIGLLWAVLLLLRTLSSAHGFSSWRSIGAIALTWIVILVLVPLAALLVTGYLIRL